MFIEWLLCVSYCDKHCAQPDKQNTQDLCIHEASSTLGKANILKKRIFFLNKDYDIKKMGAMRESDVIYILYTNGLSEEITFNLIPKYEEPLPREGRGVISKKGTNMYKSSEIGKSLENSRK